MSWTIVALTIVVSWGGAAPAVRALANGTLLVDVVDDAGMPAPGASVALRRIDPPSKRFLAASADGTATFLGLAPGRYEVEAKRGETLLARGEATIRQGETLQLEMTLASTLVEESVEVSEQGYELFGPSVVHHLDPRQLEPLPLARDVRALAQVVPGVAVVPNSSGLEVRYEPASKAGNFYHDRGAGLGSRDNTYQIDGFDYTSMSGGAAGLLPQTDIIADQGVLTSGLPAEYPGGAGYVVNLVTRNGGARWSGSATAFLETPGVRADVKNQDSRLSTPAEDRWDAGFSAGGPLGAEWARLFVAGQQRENSDPVVLSSSAVPEPRSSTFRFRRSSLFAKTSLALTDRDDLALSYYSEPQETTGSRNVNLVPIRYARSEVDQDLWSLGYGRTLGARGFLGVRGHRFRRTAATVPEEPQAGPTNTLLFAPGQSVPAYERQLGSSGDAGEQHQDKDQIDGSLSFLLGSHDLEVGGRWQRWVESNGTRLYFGYFLTSLEPGLRGIDAAEAVDLFFLPESELFTILRELRAAPGDPAFAVVDTDGDGVITADELAAMTFSSVADNVAGVNFLRRETLEAGVNPVTQEAAAVFIQDHWRFGRWTISLDARFEDRSYRASDGSTILDMGTAVLPRVGAALDLRGDGRHQLALSYGEYADPILSPMLRFAGNLTGSIFAEQVRIGEHWFTYRTRGSRELPRDAIFAPNLENESEKELQVSYSGRPRRGLHLLAQAFYRDDDHLIEDYDPSVYFNPAVAGDLVLQPEDFGFTDGVPTGVNYFLGNLVGGNRRTYGLDLAADLDPPAGNWRTSVQYSWRDAKGNSNSNAAADLQGDFLQLDPRQLYMWGDLPGTLEHQLKVFGSWRTPIGLEIGGLLYWNSGAVFTEADIFRPTTHAIFMNHRRADGSYVETGNQKQPGYTTLDLRLRYALPLHGAVGADLYLDVLNALDNQDALRVEEGHNDPEFGYLAPRLLLEPRRLQVGVRVGFGE